MNNPRTHEQETALYSYRIASADMKYIEINTRKIYLRADPVKGLVLRGELPGCGPSCHASLSEVFLEYSMSCKGCEEPSVMLESVDQFGKRLGTKVASIFLAEYPERKAQDIVPIIFDCVVESMGVPFQKESGRSHQTYQLQESPLGISAGMSGLKLWVSPAYQGLVAFFESILQTVGGGWALHSPKVSDKDYRLLAINLKKAS